MGKTANLAAPLPPAAARIARPRSVIRDVLMAVASLRVTVSREQPHCTGLESTIHTSSVHNDVSAASRRMTAMSRKIIFRIRLL